MNLLHRAAVAAMIVAPVSLAQAQETLEPVVVVAARQPIPVGQLTADATVLEREDIDAAGPGASLGDLLANVAGVALSRPGGRGAAEGVLVRGANSEHTLVLLDGLRVGSATLGLSTVSAIPLAQVERIEILRGAGSALYGSDAIGGVISITTRQGAGAPELVAQAGVGSRGLRNTDVAHAGRVAGITYRIRAGKVGEDGQNAIVNPTSDAYFQDRDGYWRRHLGAELSWAPVAGHVLAANYLESAGETETDAGSWLFGPPFPSADHRTRTDVALAGVRWQARWSDRWSSELRLGQSRDRSSTTPSAISGQSADVFRTTQGQAAWQNTLASEWGNFVLALERLEEHVDSTNAFDRRNRTTASALIGWDKRSVSHLVNASIRYDDNSQFGSTLTHSAGYGYRFTESWRVVGNVGTSFKAPTFNSLYLPYTPFVGGGNPALKPEQGRSREIGIHYARSGATLGLVLFDNRIRDLIQWQEQPAGSWEYFPSNVGKARMRGTTLSGGHRWGPWRASVDLTVQQARNLDTGEDLVRRARRQGGFSASYDNGTWLAGIDGRAVGRRQDAPDFMTGQNTRVLERYTVYNVRAEYRIDKRWTVLGRVDNLFAADYALVRSSTSDFAAPGRQSYLGVRWLLD